MKNCITVGSVFLLMVLSWCLAGASQVVLFQDDFNWATKGSVASPSSTKWSGSVAGYASYLNCYDAGGAVKFGTTSANGALTTTNLAVSAGTLTVEMEALGWSGTEKILELTVGNETVQLTCTKGKDTSTEFDTFSQDFTVEAGTVAVTFGTLSQANKRRAFVNSIRVYQTSDEGGEGGDEGGDEGGEGEGGGEGGEGGETPPDPPVVSDSIVLFNETFSDAFETTTTAWNSTKAVDTDGVLATTLTDVDGWTGSLVKLGPSGSIRLGNNAPDGVATTPLIELALGLTSADITVALNAVTLAEQNGKLQIQVLNSAGDIVYSSAVLTLAEHVAASTTVANCTGAAQSLTIPNVPSAFQICFRPLTSGRVFLDDIQVSQSVDTSLESLPTPTGLSASDVTQEGFSVSWNAVEGATRYDVEVYEDATATCIQERTVMELESPSCVLTGLQEDTSYSVRVMALGDSSIVYPSVWSSFLTQKTLVDLQKPTFTRTDVSPFYPGETGQLRIQATGADAAPLTVAWVDIIPDPYSQEPPVFDATTGILSWVAEPGDEGRYTLTFSTTLPGGKTYTTEQVLVVEKPELQAVTPEVSAIESRGFQLSWDDPQPSVKAYALRVWSGSDDYTLAGANVAYATKSTPAGWTGTEAVETDGSEVAPLKFEATGEEKISPLYPNVVTELRFVIHRSGTGSGDLVNTFRVYASQGGEAAEDWVQVTEFVGFDSVTGSDVNPKQVSLPFSAELGYRRFKFEYTVKGTAAYNFNVGSIAAFYEGAGPQFRVGSATEPVMISCEDSAYQIRNLLKPETDYCVEFTVVNCFDEQAATRQKLTTKPAQKMTLMVIQ